MSLIYFLLSASALPLLQAIILSFSQLMTSPLKHQTKPRASSMVSKA